MKKYLFILLLFNATVFEAQNFNNVTKIEILYDDFDVFRVIDLDCETFETQADYVKKYLLIQLKSAILLIIY